MWWHFGHVPWKNAHLGEWELDNGMVILVTSGIIFYMFVTIEIAKSLLIQMKWNFYRKQIVKISFQKEIWAIY